METVLSNLVNMLNNSMQSYITYLYVRELCQTLVILMFALEIVAGTPVFTTVNFAVLSIAQQEGGTRIIVAKA